LPNSRPAGFSSERQIDGTSIRIEQRRTFRMWEAMLMLRLIASAMPTRSPLRMDGRPPASASSRMFTNSIRLAYAAYRLSLPAAPTPDTSQTPDSGQIPDTSQTNDQKNIA